MGLILCDYLSLPVLWSEGARVAAVYPGKRPTGGSFAVTLTDLSKGRVNE